LVLAACPDPWRSCMPGCPCNGGNCSCTLLPQLSICVLTLCYCSSAGWPSSHYRLLHGKAAKA
ncbi:hypothetical protein BAE44_0019084, partial [Dichanthelium oligosanthes]